MFTSCRIQLQAAFAGSIPFASRMDPNWEEIDRLPDTRAESRVEQILDRLLQISPVPLVTFGALLTAGWAEMFGSPVIPT